MCVISGYCSIVMSDEINIIGVNTRPIAIACLFLTLAGFNTCLGRLNYHYFYCQARGPDHVQVNSRRLQGLKKLLVFLKSQGLDLEIDSIIGRYHPPPTTHPGNFSGSNNTVISSWSGWQTLCIVQRDLLECYQTLTSQNDLEVIISMTPHSPKKL